MITSASAPMYPRLLRRVRAVLIDYVIFIAVFLLWLFMLSTLDSVRGALKAGSLIAALFLLEPTLVARTGGTIGHHLMGLRIQDAGSQSIVVLRQPDSVARSERLSERALAPAGYELPGALRRSMAILGWAIISLLLFSGIMELSVSERCFEFDACTDAEEITSTTISLLWFASLVPIIIFGWRGQLFGCRRRKLEPGEPGEPDTV